MKEWTAQQYMIGKSGELWSICTVGALKLTVMFAGTCVLWGPLSFDRVAYYQSGVGGWEAISWCSYLLGVDGWEAIAWCSYLVGVGGWETISCSGWSKV